MHSGAWEAPCSRKSSVESGKHSWPYGNFLFMQSARPPPGNILCQRWRSASSCLSVLKLLHPLPSPLLLPIAPCRQLWKEVMTITSPWFCLSLFCCPVPPPSHKYYEKGKPSFLNWEGLSASSSSLETPEMSRALSAVEQLCSIGLVARLQSSLPNSLCMRMASSRVFLFTWHNFTIRD